MSPEKVLRVSEVYTSVQGEGPRTGMGTVFLRFGGCNLRCPGWPCDTIYAIDPKYRSEWARGSGRSVLASVIGECDRNNVENVCLTGGEPFLQNHDALRFIVDGLLREDIQVEAFSNGQIKYPDWAFEKVNFIMDWKLPGSGNAADRNEETFCLMVDNIKKLKLTDAIKLVIKDHNDFNHAVEVWKDFDDETQAQWWAGVVWGQDFTSAHLVDLIQQEQLPWNLNVQTHKYLWPAEARGV